MAPCRVVDTRDAKGETGGPALAAGAVRSFPVGGICGVPPTAKAVAVNVTVVSPTVGGYLTIFPAGTAMPLASTINFQAGSVRANNAIMTLGTSGGVSVFMGGPPGTAHFLIDVNGYFE